MAALRTADMAQISLGIGVATVVIAMTIRRMAKENRERHHVSDRARALLGEKLPMHIKEHLARFMDPKYICLAIAENKLTTGPLLEKIAEIRSSDRHRDTKTTDTKAATNEEGRYFDEDDREGLTESDFTPPTAGSSMGYCTPWGPDWLRKQLAEMMEKRMFKRPVDPDYLCFAAGVTAALRLLMLAITEEGQGCLIPAPYFAGFNYTLAMAGVKPWPVVVSSADGGVEAGIDVVISPRALQAGYRAARAKSDGAEVRVLLLTSPHNPTGRLYSPKALLGAVAWARKKGLHVVVDEIYANTVHRLHATFRSLGSLLTQDNGPGMGNDVHIVYGPAKDLGVAGWRVGALYSENKEVVSAVRHMCHTCEASSDTLNLYGRLLQAPGFMDSYYQQSQEGLRTAYVSLVHALGQAGIMHLQAEAGVFLMLDLREYLKDSTMESEARLWRQIVDNTGVNLTPGAALHCPEPGWFRMCYAFQPIDVVSCAVERLSSLLRTLIPEGEQEPQEKSHKPPETMIAPPEFELRNKPPQQEEHAANHHVGMAQQKEGGAEADGSDGNHGAESTSSVNLEASSPASDSGNSTGQSRDTTSKIETPNAAKNDGQEMEVSFRAETSESSSDGAAGGAVRAEVGQDDGRGGLGGDGSKSLPAERPPTLMNSPDALSVVDTDDEHDEALLAIGQALVASRQSTLEGDDNGGALPEVVLAAGEADDFTPY